MGWTLITSCAGQPVPSNSALTQISGEFDCRVRIPFAVHQVGSLLESGLLLLQLNGCYQSSSRCWTVPGNDDFQKDHFQNHRALEVPSISTYSVFHAGPSLYLGHYNSQLIVSQGISKIFLLLEKNCSFSLKEMAQHNGQATQSWVLICYTYFEQAVFFLSPSFLA